ncbi:hypothetical protein PHYSODRAFT_468352 [Phytophthora sojae]|uniref:Uncharacterized protein n=1 Tax=Phytophthora sojae (strain P6497) TaxID=1094619 RepID=G4YQL2_PHYSP|nr:hypothetical protein PHYSODRAFT_468352 [Phytophthora sojae]EGZ30276.1 hypothetical protein PHYSODRAFT_468352 [Phytophthora sojae]|eukprot:XP_009517551.1 hypothetical protein PHYSODRAFT_468352 [Phytophthora sojae]
MSRDDVRVLRRKFDDEDGSHSDTVTVRGFFHLINDDKAFERSHLVTKELLRLAGITTSVARVTFDQFLRVVCTFAVFSDVQLWRFFYDAFFAGGIDAVNARRLNSILEAAGGSYARNIEAAARHFKANAISPLTGLPSTLTFEDFQELVRRNIVVFFPLVQMQRSVRARTLGEKYWERKMKEQQLVPLLVEYLRKHDGHLPRMSLKVWVMTVVLGGYSAMARARALARRQYLEESRAKA